MFFYNIFFSKNKKRPSAKELLNHSFITNNEENKHNSMLVDLIQRYKNWVKENPDWKKSGKKQELINKLKENITDLTHIECSSNECNEEVGDAEDEEKYIHTLIEFLNSFL